MNQIKGLCLLARLILPIDSPPVENGYLLIRNNCIFGFGQKKDLNATKGEFDFVDCGESVILPAFVNAHAHLDYTCLHGKIKPQKNFTTWIKEIVAAKKQLTAQDFKTSWKTGAEMLLRTGCGIVANIESAPNLIPEIWGETPLVLYSLIEILGVQNRDFDFWNLIKSKREMTIRANNIGISPHSLYSTNPELLKKCFEFAIKENLLVSVHIAESKDEYEMFKSGRGELIEWLKSLGRQTSDCGYGSPVRILYKYEVPQKMLLVHANYIDDDDVELIRRNNASVVHCPRSFSYFGHEQFHLRKLLDAGINVCLGTDSLASTGLSENREDNQLNMFSEMRQFASVYPEIEPALILRMATKNGAIAIGMENKYGVIKKGAYANLVGIPYSGKIEDAYEATVNYKGESVGFTMIEGKIKFAEGNYKELASKFQP